MIKTAVRFLMSLDEYKMQQDRITYLESLLKEIEDRCSKDEVSCGPRLIAEIAKMAHE